MKSNRYILSNITGFNEILNDDPTNCEILKLNKIQSRTSNASAYKVIRYDKNMLCVDLVPIYGLCRSIIINSNNKVVGFSPPKSIPSETFIQKYKCHDPCVVLEQFIEGTMINVFWDGTLGETGGWEISTRNTVGATSSFYKIKNAKTFREMFFEATYENNLQFTDLDKKYCYSFVVQHPENRIVVPFKKPQLYLVAVYSINNENNNIYVDTLDTQQFKDFFRSTTVMFPEIYKFDTYSDLIETYASMNTRYDCVGVMLHNKITGERSKIRNPVYEEVRNLRGNQPKLQYQYLCLRKEGKVREFLKFYPENKPEFSDFRDRVHLFTNTLFSNYIACYVKKEMRLKDFSQQYRTHMFNLHQKFINELRDKKLFITNTIVQKYVNELHPSLLMYCLNLQIRKRNIDAIVAESKI